MRAGTNTVGRCAAMMIAMTLGATLAAQTNAPPPVSVFADLDGSWEGEFIGYGDDGRERYRMRVRQTYTTINDHTQRVEMTETAADGKTVTGTGMNIATRDPSGALVLRCLVTKSNGDSVVHSGQLGMSQGGTTQIVWSARGRGRTEIFRETLTRDGDRIRYDIDGAGHYGDTVMLMAGQYWRVSAGTGAHPVGRDQPSAP